MEPVCGAASLERSLHMCKFIGALATFIALILPLSGGFGRADEATIYRCTAKDAVGIQPDGTLDKNDPGAEIKRKEFWRVVIDVRVPPDTNAAIFWLKNRRKELWRDVHKIEHAHEIKSSAEILEELRAEIADLGLTPEDLFGSGEERTH